ncbi:TolC family protein [Pelagibaculum spongiae]|uniref:TolC family protein n=1 Tax=Pelagibaculum spongiae TaxID=2080658 RepID=UPI0011AB4882|nr:TolC family protein [Pelagibaculum spongiae]
MSSTAHALDLNQTIKTALQENPYIYQQQQLVEVNQQEINLTKSRRLPQINLSADAGWSQRKDETTEANSTDNVKGRAGIGVNGRWDFYDGGRYAGDLSASEKRYLAARSSLAAVQQDVAMRVIQAYYDVYLNREQLAFSSDVAKAYDDLVAHVEKRVKKGLAPEYELSEARLARSEIDFRAQSLQQALIEAEAAFFVEASIPPNSLEEPIRPNNQIFQQQDAEKWKTLALENNPMLQQLAFNAQALNNQVDVAASASKPTLAVEASHRWDDGAEELAGDRQDSSVLLRMNWQLTGQSTSSQVNKAQAQYRSAKAELQYRQKEITRQIQVISYSRKSALASLDLYGEDLKRIQQLLKASRKRLEMSTGSNSGVSAAVKVLKQYQSAQDGYLKAYFESQLLAYRLLHATGLLNEALDLPQHNS